MKSEKTATTHESTPQQTESFSAEGENLPFLTSAYPSLEKKVRYSKILEETMATLSDDILKIGGASPE